MVFNMLACSQVDVLDRIRAWRVEICCASLFRDFARQADETPVNSIMNKRYYFVSVALACVAILLASFRSPSAVPAIPYPEGYREWTHVKTYIVGPKNPAFKLIGGFNHVYANDVAMKGYTTGDFPDGSVIVSDVISTVEDSITIREDSRHHIDVMVKGNGAWDFESFRGDSKSDRMLTPDVVAKCVNCHRKDKNMVFSEYRR
jgi:hypothetical protein